MSVAIAIQFLTGRYHATPWDKQVNEGAVEWPPSPWRILRSLVAAYYRLPERPERSLMLALMTKLAEQPPSYVLPPFTAAHTRHFMPLWKEGKSTTTKVLDTFYALPGGALAESARVEVLWPEVPLSEDAEGLLARLCAQVSYLGRAESWVTMRLVAAVGEVNARPIATEVDAARDESVIKVLVPLNAAALVGFTSALAGLPRPQRGKRGRWTAPEDLLAVLELDVGQLQQEGWHGIPGSRWALYGLKSVKPRRSGSSERGLGGSAMARFGLSSKVLPQITAALSVGERWHRALMSCSKEDQDHVAEVFAGRDAQGEPLQRDHAHAWYLPECNERGEITNVVVYSPSGFSLEAKRALQRMEKVWGSGGFDIYTDLVLLGEMDRIADARDGGVNVVGTATVWQSLTPFVLPRFPKRKRIDGSAFSVDGPEDQALRLLRLLPMVAGPLGLDGAERFVSEDGDWLGMRDAGGNVRVRVRCVEAGWLDRAIAEDGSQRFPWQRFQRTRSQGQGARSLGTGYWLEVQFGQPVRGPIALGYGAHFGLGVLVPCAEA